MVRKYVRGIVHKEEGPGLTLSKNIKVPTFIHMQTIESAQEIFQRGYWQTASNPYLPAFSSIFDCFL